MLVDSHCHLDYEPLAKDKAGAIARAKNAGIERFVNINTTMREFEQVHQTAIDFDEVFCTVGVHPCHTHEEGETVTAQSLINLAERDKVVGLGETGLDYFYVKASRERQQESFVEHIKAAKTTGLPLIIHSRDAEEDTIKFLASEGAIAGGPIKGLMHCFSSKRILAEGALQLGFYISLSGILTFKKSEELRNIVKDIPLDRLLVETDSPFLAPEPMRGKPCEPAYVAYTANILAQVKGVSVAEIEARTTENFFTLFNKVPANAKSQIDTSIKVV